MKCLKLWFKKTSFLWKDIMLVLKEQIKTCEIWSVCDLGIDTCHHAVICKQCIFMATLESIEKN